MGNQTSHAKLATERRRVRVKRSACPHRDSKRLSICRVLGYFPDRDPDVDTLGFPFKVCKQIFRVLSIRDVASCMQVCKEWRSLIDTCEFWKAYLAQHYRIQTPSKNSVLFWWKLNQSQSESSPDVDLTDADDCYVFKPFPDMWNTGIVVPNGLCPPSGFLQLYHDFIAALNSLNSLQHLINYYGFTNIVHVCLFRWFDRNPKPTRNDVMHIFNAHELLTRNAEMLYKGEDDDLAHVVPPQGVDYEGQTNFIEIFTRCYQLGTREWILAFHCSPELLAPAPGFVVTSLASGWVGGLLYAV